MNTDTGLSPGSIEEPEGRRSGDDRRADNDRRRRAKGLFEVRAKRKGLDADRRQSERREREGRSWLTFWRRRNA